MCTEGTPTINVKLNVGHVLVALSINTNTCVVTGREPQLVQWQSQPRCHYIWRWSNLLQKELTRLKSSQPRVDEEATSLFATFQLNINTISIKNKTDGGLCPQVTCWRHMVWMFWFHLYAVPKIAHCDNIAKCKQSWLFVHLLTTCYQYSYHERINTIRQGIFEAIKFHGSPKLA